MNQREKNDEILRIIFSGQESNRTKKRALNTLLMANGISKDKTAQITSVSKKTVKKHYDRYLTKGAVSLKENPYRPKSELQDYAEMIKADLDNNPCRTINQAKARIEQCTGIKRSPTQIRNFIKKLGFKPLMTGQIPAKADVEKQKQFIENEIEPRLKQEKNGERAVFFIDAAHFVLGAYLIVLWVLKRVFVKTSPGRQRFNVLGAFSVKNTELITVVNDTYINSTTICELMKKIRERIPDQPITLILDNAKYQKCTLVFEMAKEFDIELLFLPSYSPNLNLIERLWKYVKKECLYAKYYETFVEFKNAITKCLSEVETTRKNDIKKLITTNFQTFEDIKQLGEAA